MEENSIVYDMRNRYGEKRFTAYIDALKKLTGDES